MKVKDLQLLGSGAPDVLAQLKSLLKGDVLTLVEFTQLKCHDTEDWFGHDEPYLKFHVSKVLAGLNGAAAGLLKQAVDGTGMGALVLNPPSVGDVLPLAAMTEEETEPVNRLYPVAPGRGMRVDLWEDDKGITGMLDPDDLLGRANIELTPHSEDKVEEDVFDVLHDGEVYFGRDGAYYTLSYKIHRFKLGTGPVNLKPALEDAQEKAKRLAEEALKKVGK